MSAPRKRLGGIIMLVNASEMLKKAKEGHCSRTVQHQQP